MKTYRDLVADAKRAVPEVTVEDVQGRLAQGEAVNLIDVRDPDEYREGAVAGAVPISRGFLEFKVPEAFPDPDTPLTLYCLSGLRSLLAGKVLHDLGYTNVTSMAGGIRRWKELKLPLVKDQPLTADQMERYSRHFMLTQVGEPGQKALLRSKVLLIGAGGLGSPTALYLAAAGVGTLGVVDDDVVDLSNLQRQVLHRTPDVGRPKVESARDTITALNPDVTVVPYRRAAHGRQHRADHQGLRHHRRRVRQLRHPVPGQRRLLPRGQAERPRLDLPVRGHGHRAGARPGALLPLPLSGAAPRGPRPVLKRSWRPGRAPGTHRGGAGDGDGEARSSARGSL